MSLYNMLFGEGDYTDFLLKLLDAERGDFGRFRATYVINGYIVVHTRCGGGNREEYFPEWVEDHPLYSHDVDGDFDNTYADIFFRYPPGYEDVLKEMAEGTITPSAKWKMLFEALDSK